MLCDFERRNKPKTRRKKRKRRTFLKLKKQRSRRASQDLKFDLIIAGESTDATVSMKNSGSLAFKNMPKDIMNNNTSKPSLPVAVNPLKKGAALIGLTAWKYIPSLKVALFGQISKVDAQMGYSMHYDLVNHEVCVDIVVL